MRFRFALDLTFEADTVEDAFDALQRHIVRRTQKRVSAQSWDNGYLNLSVASSPKCVNEVGYPNEIGPSDRRTALYTDIPCRPGECRRSSGFDTLHIACLSGCNRRRTVR